jgi:Protein of unknown function (DUF3074)
MAASASASAQTSPQSSVLVRLAPLQLNEIPAHPDLPATANKQTSLALPDNGSSEDVQQPDLLPFLTTILNDGLAFLSRRNLEENFKHHSNKSAPPSAADVEVLVNSISSAALNKIPWADPGTERRGSSASTNAAMASKVRRRKPKDLQAEHWFTRRSIHENVSSKHVEKPGHASWEEFLFGLRDNHSKHEEEFTPTLFDARKVVDWSGQVRKLEEEGALSREGFGDLTMSLNEMCHDVPSPLKPRVFGVLVVTASLVGNKRMLEEDHEKFVAVTVPVQMGVGVKPAFYANFRNLKEGEDSKQKREVVQGLYTAVETCTLRKKSAGEGEEIDWIMATASDTKGNLPMWVQKLALPGAVPKDVSYFTKWIKGVDDGRIENGDG